MAARDPGRDRPGAEPVVDPDDGQRRGARGQHRVQRRPAAVRDPVADRRRHADHRRRDQPPDNARQSAVHPRDDDHAIGTLQVR